MRRSMLWVGLGLCFAFGAVGVFFSGTGSAGDVHPAFHRTWERTDRPVASGGATRSWIWGPDGHTDAFNEPYADAPGGERLVQYFDKSRMELTDPDGDAESLWYITNGLLARELITGEMQIGDASFEQREPADVHIAGDAHPDSPTYKTFASVLDIPRQPEGEIITQTIDRNGTVGDDPELTRYGIETMHPVHDTSHAVPWVFWDFMNTEGNVFIDGELTHDSLFENPFFGVGFPVTGAYWLHVPIDGEWQDVLTQCFERRCLTYTPGNPENWQVEAGNIGQHYYTWRYETEIEEPDSPASDNAVPIPSNDELGPPVPGACEANTQAVFSQISDSLGNVNPNSWGQGTGGDWSGGIDASPTVNTGQQLTFTIAATGDCDPLEYRVQRYRSGIEIEVIEPWSDENTFSYSFVADDVGDYLMLIVDVRNQDPRHHFGDRDDYTYLTYEVE